MELPLPVQAYHIWKGTGSEDEQGQRQNHRTLHRWGGRGLFLSFWGIKWGGIFYPTILGCGCFWFYLPCALMPHETGTPEDQIEPDCCWSYWLRICIHLPGESWWWWWWREARNQIHRTKRGGNYAFLAESRYFCGQRTRTRTLNLCQTNRGFYFEPGTRGCTDNQVRE